MFFNARQLFRRASKNSNVQWRHLRGQQSKGCNPRAAIQGQLHSMKSALKGCNKKPTLKRHQYKGSNSMAVFHEVSIEGLQYNCNIPKAPE
jgi:hypothetical protein